MAGWIWLIGSIRLVGISDRIYMYIYKVWRDELVYDCYLVLYAMTDKIKDNERRTDILKIYLEIKYVPIDGSI